MLLQVKRSTESHGFICPKPYLALLYALDCPEGGAIKILRMIGTPLSRGDYDLPYSIIGNVFCSFF